jgi:hypothetical protein
MVIVGDLLGSYRAHLFPRVSRVRSHRASCVCMAGMGAASDEALHPPACCWAAFYPAEYEYVHVKAESV